LDGLRATLEAASALDTGHVDTGHGDTG
jgi:hypothetical protein